MAANPNKIQGALILVGLNGEFSTCQVDASFEYTTNTNEIPACKPLASESYNAARPAEYEVTGSTWQVTFSSRAFAQSTGYNQGDILETIASGNIYMPIVFGTTEVVNYDKQEVQTITGEAILTSFAWNAPGDGDSTYDVTLQGNGAFEFSRVPYTT